MPGRTRTHRRLQDRPPAAPDPPHACAQPPSKPRSPTISKGPRRTQSRKATVPSPRYCYAPVVEHLTSDHYQWYLLDAFRKHMKLQHHSGRKTGPAGLGTKCCQIVTWVSQGFYVAFWRLEIQANFSAFNRTSSVSAKCSWIYFSPSSQKRVTIVFSSG
jgi:hypothetical protein